MPARRTAAAALARVRALDRRLLRALRTRWHHPRVEAAVIAVSRAGEHGAIWHGVALVGVVAHPSGRPTYLRAIRALALTYAANTAIKQLAPRARPTLAGAPHLMTTLSARSYPSAHAAMSFAAARALAPQLPRLPLYAAATAMALSRPYLGVHYPSDVLAGAVLGDAIAVIAP